MSLPRIRNPSRYRQLLPLIFFAHQEKFPIYWRSLTTQDLPHQDFHIYPFSWARNNTRWLDNRACHKSHWANRGLPFLSKLEKRQGAIPSSTRVLAFFEIFYERSPHWDLRGRFPLQYQYKNRTRTPCFPALFLILLRCTPFSFFFYSEKLSPQPQVRCALGLLNTNPLPFKPPEYSRVVPIR